MTASPDPEIADVTSCAEIAAHLAHFPAANHAEVVARFGLGWRDWEATSAHWTAARAAELAAGGAQISSRFVQAFVTTAERLQARSVSVESIGPLPHRLQLEATRVVEPPAVEMVTSAPRVVVDRLPAEAADLGAPPFGLLAAGPAPPSAAGHLWAATAAVSDAPAPALPFASFAPAAPGAAVARAIAHAAAVQGPAAPSPAAGATIAVSALSTPPPLPSGAPELTIEQYTSLRVELHMLPDREASVLARYGSSLEAKEAIFAHWRARFEADPPLRMWFARGYAQYLAWLRQNPGALDSLTPT